MKTTYHAAVDIGASSGRLMLGWRRKRAKHACLTDKPPRNCEAVSYGMKNEQLEIQEIHRFPNGMIKRNGHLCWDVEKLFDEIIIGMKKCVEIGKTPESIGIDTWVWIS